MTIGSIGRSLELFFIDGKPEGMQTAELFNWTGHVLMAPRTRIKAALERKEAHYTGVYLLLGESEDKPLAYIGEGEDIGERIRSHDQKKDWWTQAVLVTTAANALNKAHVKYLESRLVEIARSVKRWELENANTPPRPGLSESAQANMESFLSYLLMTLPALRVDIFQEYAKPAGAEVACPSGETSNVPVFELNQKKDNLHATAQLVGDDFIVLEGSHARRNWVGKGTEQSSYALLRQQLLDNGVLVPEGEQCVFAKSYAFRSPSAGAAVILGRSASGPDAWKLADSGESYKAWEAQQLETTAAEPA